MAVIYNATITPAKPEVVDAWLDAQPWAGPGPSELVGSYRFDDPDGQVGVEAMLVRRGDAVLQAALTYRPAPLDGADEHLIATVEHSVLGRRWVYDATGDPVAVDCFRRALAGEQEQAEMEIWDGDRMIDRRDPTVRIQRQQSGSTVDRGPDGSAPGTAAAVGTGAETLLIARVASADLAGPTVLVADWSGGRAVVAAR